MKRLSLLITFPVLFLFICAGDLSQWIGKTENQITGVQKRVTKLDSTFFDGKFAAPLRALIHRTNMYRHSSDYGNIQAAVDSGGVVTIDPQDTVNVTTSIATSSYLAITGSGFSSVIKSTKSSISSLPVVYVYNDSFVVISGINFQPDSSDSYLIEHDACIYIKNSKYVIITDCLFNATGDGICLDHDSDNNGKNQHIIISNCIFRGGYYEATGWAYPCSRNGISIVDGHDVTITGCTFEGFFGPGCIDMEPNTGLNNSVSEITITGNTFRNKTHGVIATSGSELTSIDGVTITGNTFIGTNYDGYTMDGSAVWLQGFVYNTVVSSNTIKDQSYGSYPGVFIRAVRENVIVANNDIYNCALHGIQTLGLCDGLTITNNSIHDCGWDGIYLYSIVTNCTASCMTNPDMELTTGWTSVGTPTTQARSSTYKYAGSYSRSVVTDADSEGIKQTLKLTATDTAFWFKITARVYVTDDDKATFYNGKVSMAMTGVREQYEIAYASECEYDSSWVEFGCYFRPNASTVEVVVTSDANMAYYVDGFNLMQLSAPAYLNVSDNRLWNNTTSGIRGDYIFSSTINNNLTYNSQSRVSQTRTQLVGMKLNYCIDTDVLGNKAYNNINYDTYLTNMYKCNLSSIGVDVPYSTNLKYCNFPYATMFTFYADSLSEAGVWQQSTGTDDKQQIYMMPRNGRVVGISACFTAAPVKSAGFRVYPVFGDNIREEVHTSGGAYFLVISGTNRAASMNVMSNYLSFQQGEMLTVLMEGNSNVIFTGNYNGLRTILLIE